MAFHTIVVTGTDTDVGKTVFAAALAGALKASYWKPVQAGLDDSGASDSDRVARLSGLSPSAFVPEVYRLATPCSPHRAAEIDGVVIDPERLAIPQIDGSLVIEGAGGVMVPLTRERTYVDTFADWGCPVVLVARTTLGTINHSLMSLEALRSRGVGVLGMAFVGDPNDDSEATICEMGQVRRLGRLPMLAVLDRDSLSRAFHENFSLRDFAP